MKNIFYLNALLIIVIFLNQTAYCQNQCHCHEFDGYVSYDFQMDPKLSSNDPNYMRIENSNDIIRLGFYPKLDHNFPNYESNELILTENFNTTSIDFTKWQISRNDGGLTITFKDDNVFESGGFLHCRAKAENPSIMSRPYPGSPANFIPATDVLNDGLPNYRSYGYSKGQIETKQLFKYGIFEIRAKTPQIHGVHPAMWFYSGTDSFGEEIDIMEMSQGQCKCSAWNWDANLQGDKFGPCENKDDGEIILEHEDYTSGRVFQSLHYGTYNTSSTVFRCTDDYWQNFHTYKLDWDEYRIYIYLDNAKYLEYYHYYYVTNINGIDVPFEISNYADAMLALNANYTILTNPKYPRKAANLLITVVRLKFEHLNVLQFLQGSTLFI